MQHYKANLWETNTDYVSNTQGLKQSRGGMRLDVWPPLLGEGGRQNRGGSCRGLVLGLPLPGRYKHVDSHTHSTNISLKSSVHHRDGSEQSRHFVLWISDAWRWAMTVINK